jgi:hypothetical protein
MDQRVLFFMKIHFVGKSLWFMQNNNEVKESLIIVIVCCKKSKVISCRILGSVIFKLDIL